MQKVLTFIIISLTFLCFEAFAQPTFNAKTLNYQGLNFQAQTINNKGQVLATVYSPQQKGALYTRGGVDGEYVLYPLNPELGYASDLNNHGQITGVTLESSSLSFLWTPDENNGVTGAYVTFNGTAQSLNDLGQVVGNNYNTGQGFCYNCNFQFNSLSNNTNNQPNSTNAYNLNNLGQAAGEAYLAYNNTIFDYPSRAVIYTQNGTSVIGTLGGYFGGAQSINDLGVVVGWMNPFTTLSKIYTQHAFITSPTLTDIHSLGTYSYAQDINNNNEVVGGYSNGGFYYTQQTGMRDLNSLLDSNSVYVTSAKAINSCGQILADTNSGSAVLTPHDTAFLFELDPISDSGDLTLNGASSDREVFINAQRKCLKLKGLSALVEDQGKLIGENAIEYPSPNITLETNMVYEYARKSKNFHATMAYYHSDAVTRYVHDVLNLSSNRILPIYFKIDDSLANANYDSSTRSINLGIISGVHTAEDAEVIWHENGHQLREEFNPGFRNNVAFDEEYAIDEGFSDFFAIVGLWDKGSDSYIGKWIASNIQNSGNSPASLRNLANTKRYPLNYQEPLIPNSEEDVNRVGHVNGEIIGGALWDLLSTISKERIVKTALETINRMDSSRNFEEFAVEFLLTNARNYQSADEETIKNVFFSRGLLVGISSVIFNPDPIPSGASSTALVSLTQLAHRGGTDVEIVSSRPDIISVPASITVTERQLSATVDLTASSVSQEETVDITFSHGDSSLTKSVVVKPPSVFTLTLNRNTVVGSNDVTGTISLVSPAPQGGATILLSSSNPAASVPASIKINKGANSKSFTVNTNAVGSPISVNISASYANAGQTKSFSITPPSVSKFEINPNQVEVGNIATGKITLSEKAPPGGALVQIYSNKPNAQISYPSSVLISEGSKLGSFSIGTQSASTYGEDVIFTVVYNGSIDKGFRVLPTVDLRSLSVSPSTVSVGENVTISATLISKAPAGSIIVNLSATNGLNVPSGILIPEGSKTGTVSFNTSGVSASQAYTITGSVVNSISKELTVTP